MRVKFNKTLFLRTIFALSAIILMVLIFYFSSQNGTVSSQTSGGLISRLSVYFIKGFENFSPQKQLQLISDLQFFVRKSVHFIVFAALGFSYFGFFSTFNFSTKVNTVISLFCAAFYAASDEIHQIFVEGRSGEIRDFFIDTSGSLFGILLLIFIFRIFTKKKRSKRG